jgi:hypothetical protein
MGRGPSLLIPPGGGSHRDLGSSYLRVASAGRAGEEAPGTRAFSPSHRTLVFN